MKIDRVIRAVRKLERGKKGAPIAVYMSVGFHSECKSEIRGAVPPAQYEFLTEGTVLGHPVYTLHEAPLFGVAYVNGGYKT